MKQRHLVYENQIINYSVRRSGRAKRARISVSGRSGVVAVLPLGIAEQVAEKFVREKAAWIFKALTYIKSLQNRFTVKSSRRDYLDNRLKALNLAKSKVAQWSHFYGFKYSHVRIKNQKTRWGSCSKKGNLNFNYKIVYLPEYLVDYLIVHELCHLKEMNHSKKFWELVARAIPEYKTARRELLRSQN